MNADMMNADILALFEKMPDALPLFMEVDGFIRSSFDDVTRSVHKTQVSYKNRHGFAFLSPPFRRVKGRPEVYIILSFGLSYQVEDRRIAEASNPYPNRWTHHVIIAKSEDFDEVVKGWIFEAHDFSNNKGPGRR